MGIPNGPNVVDVCGICGGDNSTCLDCSGVPGGNAVIDLCGQCQGNNSTCCYNYLGIDNTFWNYILLPIAIDEQIYKLQRTYAVVNWIYQNFPTYREISSQTQSLGLLAEISKYFLDKCLGGLCNSSSKFLKRLDYINQTSSNCP